MKLRLAPDFTLPLEAVTSTFGLLAVRRAGKSNAAAVLAEEFFRAKLPFVVVDPKGDWFGLRSSADGKGPGLPIPIFGGDHGDVPLEAAGGAFLAELIAEQRLSCLVDTSAFSEGDKTRFLIDFAERLYRKNREALHVILEEADDYIPQRPFREQARCVGAFERLVKRGGFRGLGVTLISQRSAALNKNVLTQVETLLVLRTTSPQDRKAIEGWIEHQGAAKTVLDSLPSLADGEAWVWSPHFLRLTEPRRVHFRRRETFDSGATPKATERRREPATLADVDLGAIRTKMAATIERAKAEDPRELRRQVAELKAQLAKAAAAKPAAPMPAAVKVQRIAVPMLRPRDISRLEGAARTIGAVADVIAHLRAELEQARKRAVVAVHVAPRPETVRALAAVARAAVRGGARESANLSGPERKLLTALAQHGRRSVTALALLTGYAANGGAFRNPLGKLRSQSYVCPGDPVEITEAGLGALGEWMPLPTGPDLLAYWFAHLPGPDAKLLRAVAAVYPQALSVEALAAATGYEASGGAFRNPLGRLRTLHLVEGRDAVRASAELF